MIRLILFLSGVQLCSVCILAGAVLAYNGRGFWWVFLLMALGFLPTVKIR